jgi:hypothetical protein
MIEGEPSRTKAIGLDAKEFKVRKFNVQQAVEKSKECFDKLSMNGNFSVIQIFLRSS